MKIVKVTHYSYKGHINWGIKLHLDNGKVIEAPQQTIESFLSENVMVLSNHNIIFLRDAANKPQVAEHFETYNH